MPPFWYAWGDTPLGSWIVELLGGAALAVAALLVVVLVIFLGKIVSAALIAAALSYRYELQWDVNRGKPEHKPWVDIGQRALGSLVVLVLAALLL